MAAIYMWFEHELQIWTTTLYPIEVNDSLQFACNLTYGEMRIVQVEEIDLSSDLLAITIEAILLDYGPDDVPFDLSSDLLSITIEQILFTYGPDDVAFDQSSDLLSITIQDKLVIADTPDERLQLGCNVNPSGCSLTPV